MPDLRPRAVIVARDWPICPLQVRSDKPRGIRDTEGARLAGAPASSIVPQLRAFRTASQAYQT